MVTHLELVWHLMLIMTLLVLSMGSIQYVMDLLADVLNVLNEVIISVRFELDMSQIFLSNCKWYGYINGTDWLESQSHLKMVLPSGDMESFVVVMQEKG